MKILVSGSLAYDRILDFPGKFSDSILPDKIHNLNVSFFVPEMKESFGGCAGNISYGLALLGQEPLIIARGGNDFAEYNAWLQKNAIATGSIEIDLELRTATATILTDSEDNQISSFYAVANGKAYSKKIPHADFATISPGNPEDIRTLPEVFRSRNIPFMFDPGQSLPVLSGDDLKNGIEGAKVLISNDYELSLIKEKTGWNEKEILAHAEMLITTFGEKGSRVQTKTDMTEVKAAQPKNVSDPTGAGDAYRAGFLAGLAGGFAPKTCAQMGAIAACYTVEREGTQTHSFTKEEFEERYKENFNDIITL